MLNMCVYVCYSLFIYENMTTHTYKMTFADVLVNGFTNFKAVQNSLVKLAKYAKTFHKHPRMSTHTHTHAHASLHTGPGKAGKIACAGVCVRE